MKNRLMQLFSDNATRPKFNAEANGDESTVYLYDAIGGWYGLEAEPFVKDLVALDSGTVHLRINSPGGDVFEARAIATTIKQMKCKTVAHIDGVAASAATYIALACDEVEMAEGARMMIHKGWTMELGNDDEMRKTADLLTSIDDSIIQDYHIKTKINKDELRGLMAAETWYTEDQALEAGFVDRIFTGREGASAKWNLSAYENAPKDYIDEFEKTVDNDTEVCYDRARFERRLALMETRI